jgi:hypothetical protein
MAFVNREASDWRDEWSSEADGRPMPSRYRAAPAPDGAAISVDELMRALVEFEPEFEPESATPPAPRIVQFEPEALVPARIDPRRSLARRLLTTVAASVLLIALAGLAPPPPSRVPPGISVSGRVPHDVALPAAPATTLMAPPVSEAADARPRDSSLTPSPGATPMRGTSGSVIARAPTGVGSPAEPTHASQPPVVAPLPIGQRGSPPPASGLVLSTSTGEDRTGPLPAAAPPPDWPSARLAIEPEPAPVAPRPAASAPAARAPAAPTARQIIYGVLAEYQGALNRLDVAAVHAIWPSLDAASLERAFTQLERQSVLFDTCSVAIIGDGATARCQGSSAYVPRVGRRTERLEPRHWRIELKQADATWHIVAVDARD